MPIPVNNVMAFYHSLVLLLFLWRWVTSIHTYMLIQTSWPEASVKLYRYVTCTKQIMLLSISAGGALEGLHPLQIFDGFH